MHNLLLKKKPEPFIRSNECQTSPNCLKHQILSSKILKDSDFEPPFILATNALGFAFETILS